MDMLAKTVMRASQQIYSNLSQMDFHTVQPKAPQLHFWFQTVQRDATKSSSSCFKPPGLHICFHIFTHTPPLKAPTQHYGPRLSWESCIVAINLPPPTTTKRTRASSETSIHQEDRTGGLRWQDLRFGADVLITVGSPGPSDGVPAEQAPLQQLQIGTRGTGK